MRLVRFLESTSRLLTRHPDRAGIVAVVLLGLWAAAGLAHPGYFWNHEEGVQIVHQRAMEDCFLDGQLACRWTPLLGNGYGLPVFNYYPPLPYLLGETPRFVGLSFTDTVKVGYGLTFVLSGLTMYLLARGFWGPAGGVVAGALYVWAPYRAVDVYVRGALNESWSFVWFPLLLWSSHRLARAPSRAPFIALALSWAALLLTHLPMALLMTPLLAAWVVLWTARSRRPRLLVSEAGALVAGAALAAFFVVPVLLERDLVHIERALGAYSDHFATWNQLLVSRFWGTGASIAGPGDGMAFPVGLLPWSLATGVALWWAVAAFRRRGRRAWRLGDGAAAAGALFAAAWAAVAMAHAISLPVWRVVPGLGAVQFPWRALGLAAVGFAFVGGAIVRLLPADDRDLRRLVVALVAVVAVGASAQFFQIERVVPWSDDTFFYAPPHTYLQYKHALGEYSPRTSEVYAWTLAEYLAEVESGQALVGDQDAGTDWVRFRVLVASEEAAVQINVVDFPDWRVEIDGRRVTTRNFVASGSGFVVDLVGRIHVVVPHGAHLVEARLHDTPPRVAGEAVTVLAGLGLLVAGSWGRIGPPARARARAVRRRRVRKSG